MKVSSTGSTPGGRPSSMPGNDVPEKPVTAVEPGWMIVVSCACACVANHRLGAERQHGAARGQGCLASVEIPLSRTHQGFSRSSQEKPPARERPNAPPRAIPALSPLAIRCPPLAPAKIRRACRCVNGIGLEPADRNRHGGPILVQPRSIPLDRNTSCPWSMGCSSCQRRLQSRRLAVQSPAGAEMVHRAMPYQALLSGAPLRLAFEDQAFP